MTITGRGLGVTHVKFGAVASRWFHLDGNTETDDVITVERGLRPGVSAASRRLVAGALALALGLILVVAGCQRRAEATISKEDYLKSGNQICAQGNEKIAASARQPAAGASSDSSATFVRVFVPGIRDQLRQLRALGYPKGDKLQLDAIFNDAEALLRRAERDPSTIDGHAFDDVNRRLTAYGLRICGS